METLKDVWKIQGIENALVWMKHSMSVNMSNGVQVILGNGDWANRKIAKRRKVDIFGNVEYIHCESPWILDLGVWI